MQPNSHLDNISLQERYKKSREEVGTAASRGKEKVKAREEDRFRLISTKRAIKVINGFVEYY